MCGGKNGHPPPSTKPDTPDSGPTCMEWVLPDLNHRHSETDLVRRLKADETAAYDELFREYKRIVWSVCYRVLRNGAAADDATQKVFVRAWKSIGRFRGDSLLKTWLLRIALNVSRTMVSRTSMDTPLDSIKDPVDARQAPGERLEAIGLSGRLRRAVDRLAPRQRQVVQLKVFGELTHAETAHVMHLAPGSVKAHLHQAIANLRAILAEEETEDVT